MADNNVPHLSATDAIVITKAAVSPHGTPLQLALFGPDGSPITLLSSETNQMPVQAASVAADVATLVTDFNALLTKLKNADLMASA